MDSFCFILLVLLAAMGQGSEIQLFCFENKEQTQVLVKVFDHHSSFYYFDEFKGLSNTWIRVLDENCRSIQDPTQYIITANATLSHLDLKLENLKFSITELNQKFYNIQNFDNFFNQILTINLNKASIVLNLYFENERKLISSCSDLLCESCVDSKCEIVADGYYIDSNYDIQSCPWGCKTCAGPDTCSECFSGFFISSSVCHPCLGNCFECINQTFCITCNFGYFIDNYYCNPCMEGCNICKNSSHCGDCTSNYYLNSTGQCVKCQENCETCTSSKCTKAKSGYFIGSTILPCSANCAQCSSLDTCKTCDEGFYLDLNSTCKACSSNCKSCSDVDECGECDHGYFLTPNGYCSQCKNNCEECEVSNICETCEGGFYFHQKDAKCILCSGGCSYCNEGTCISCISIGFYLNQSSCISCDSGAGICTGSSSISCVSGYELTDGVCKKCESNCLTCYEGKCTSCYEGYYLNETCVKCQHGCLDCIQNECLYCSSGFFKYNGNCILCPSECSTCLNETICTSCKIGFYLSDSQCSSCADYVYACADADTSLKCIQKYYLDNSDCSKCVDEECGWCSGTGGCYECVEGSYLNSYECFSCVDLNCAVCNQTDCFECLNGFYLYSGECKSCSTGCSSCQGTDSCEVCENGYYLNDGASCVECPENCGFCNSFQCIQCESGYIIDANGICKICNSQKCLCSDGYYNSGDYQCEPCPFECKTCSNSTFCQTCRDGFLLNNKGICSECDYLNCKLCDNDQCLTCNDGYFMRNNECQPCSSYCRSCTSTTNCLECSTGFYLLEAGTCLSCPSHCSSCTSQSCLSCIQGYYLSSGTCTSSIANCLIYSDSICTYCSSSYTVLNGICADCEGISIKSAQFDEYFLRLIFQFNRDIEKPNKHSCSDCKSILFSDSQIGEKCLCYGVGQNYILEFKGWYSVTVSSTFYIKTEKLFNYVCDSNELSIKVSPTYSVLPNTPYATIKGSERKSLNCIDEYLYYDIGEVTNSYGFDMNFTWFASTEPTNSLIESYALANRENYLIIPLELFQGLDSKIFIKVKAQNMLQLEGESNFTSYVYNSKMLQTEIDSPRYKVIEYSKEYVISGRVSDLCGMQSASVKWKYGDNDMESFNGGYSHLLYIAPYALEALTVHVFNFTAYSGSLTGYTEINVFVEYSPLVLVVNLTNCSVSMESDLYISTIESYNPNENEGLNKVSIFYTWIYCKVRLDGECSEEFNKTKTGNLLFVDKKDFPVNGTEWMFTVTMLTNNSYIPNDSKTFKIQFISGLKSNIGILPYDSRIELVYSGALFSTDILVLDSTANISLIWDIPSYAKEYKRIGDELPTLYLYKKNSDFVYDYAFTIKAFQNGQDFPYSFANFYFEANQGALCGSDGLLYDPSKNIVSFKTFVDLSINSCTDIEGDFPLLFRFSVKICTNNCTINVTNYDPNTYTPYFQITIKKEFSYVTCKMPAGVIKASVQVCDQLGGCNSYKQVFEATENSNLDTSNVIEQYYIDIVNTDMIPYYSIIYIMSFDLNKEEFNNIYQNFIGYLKKMKITNLDVIHILLTFTNEMFKGVNKFLNGQMIIKFLNDAASIVSRHSDQITDQNADVTAEIIYNIINSGANVASTPNLINVVINFVKYVYQEYAIGRVPGDLIVNYTSAVSNKNNFKYYKYRDTAKKILDGVSNISSVVKEVTKIGEDNSTIINIDVSSLAFANGQGIIFVQLSTSGSYNSTSFELVEEAETFINLKPKSVYLYIMNQYSSQVCVYFDGSSWIDDLCEIDKSNKNETTSGIVVSSSYLYKIDDSNSYYQEEPVTYGPIILAGVMTGIGIFAFIIFYFYERKQNMDPNKKKKKQVLEKESTCMLILSHTLVLSFLSKDPRVSKKLNLLKLLVLLNVQMTIDGLFIGFDVIKDRSWPTIVGTGFVATLITIPYNIFYLYPITKEKKLQYYSFLILWFIQLIAMLIFILIINIVLTKGKNSEWILAFAIGLICEIFIEIILMVIKNIKHSNVPLSNKI